MLTVEQNSIFIELVEANHLLLKYKKQQNWQEATKQAEIKGKLKLKLMQSMGTERYLAFISAGRTMFGTPKTMINV